MPEPDRRPRQAQLFDHLVEGRCFRVGRFASEAAAPGRPLLFFSGIGANIELLAPFLESLKGREVITFDMPGLGGSAPFSGPYRLSAMADIGARILKDLGVCEADVMGVSWGGMLAQEFAYRHPQIVNLLVLAATTAGFPLVPGSPSSLVKMVTSQRYANPDAIDDYLHSLYGGRTSGLEGYAARIRPPSSTGYLHQLLAIAGWTSVRKLTRLRASTLLLMGAEDRLVPPANGQILKFLLNHAELHVLADAGHLFLLTHRDDVAERIEAYLDRPVLQTASRATAGPSIRGPAQAVA